MTRAAEPAKRSRRYLSLRWKLLVGFTLLFTVVFALAFYWFYSFTSARALQRIRDDLRQTLEGAAAGVDADQLLALYREGQPNAAGFSDDPRFASLLDWLDTVHSIEPRAWPFLYVEGPNPGEITFVVDLYARYDPSKAAGFREAYTPVTTFPVRGFGAQVINLEPYTDKWGFWVSGYAPVPGASGGAALGVDFGADYLVEVRRAIGDRVLVAFALTYTLLFVLVFLIARAFTRPIANLTLAAEKIGEGHYDERMPLPRQQRLKDEIGILAEVFESMAARIFQREASLRHEVQVLRIEVDEAKRQQQVSEIVETDFFRDLQAKAKRLRNRTDKAGEDS